LHALEVIGENAQRNFAHHREQGLCPVGVSNVMALTTAIDDRMVLPVRIELTTSPFITLTLSRPPRAAFVRWTIPSP
jgi:hypothetical protein